MKTGTEQIGVTVVYSGHHGEIIRRFVYIDKSISIKDAISKIKNNYADIAPGIFLKIEIGDESNQWYKVHNILPSITNI